MFDPRILFGLILAGAWASGLLALDDEMERDEHRKSEIPEKGTKDQASRETAKQLRKTDLSAGEANS